MPSEKTPFQRARDIAYRYLSHRARSSHEVEKRLRERGVDESTLRQVLESLQKDKYVDDRSFARQWVECRSRNRFIGPFRLLRELQEKGIGEEIRAEAVREFFRGPEEERDLALKAAEKRLRVSQGVEKEKLKGRLSRYLTGKGFSSEAVYFAINRLVK